MLCGFLTLQKDVGEKNTFLPTDFYKASHILSNQCVGNVKSKGHFPKIMDKAAIANIEKEKIPLQIQLLKAQVGMTRSNLSESIKE